MRDLALNQFGEVNQAYIRVESELVKLKSRDIASIHPMYQFWPDCVLKELRVFETNNLETISVLRIMKFGNVICPLHSWFCAVSTP